MFEQLLTERSDAIDGATYQLILAMTGKTEDELPWDMEIIGEVADAAQEALENLAKPVCRPYYGDDDTPCYKLTECDNPDCPMHK